MHEKVSLAALIETIRADRKRNPFFKTRFTMILFRLANYLASKNKFTLILGAPMILAYMFISEWVLGIEIHPKTQIGKGLALFHGVGLVVNGYCRIGENCTLRQGVTLGNKVHADGKLSGAPVIGDNVEFGANSIVIGDVKIGDNVKIGAGTVVVKDVPDNAIVVSAPMRIL